MLAVDDDDDDDDVNVDYLHSCTCVWCVYCAYKTVGIYVSVYRMGQKGKPDYYCQPTFRIFGTHALSEISNWRIYTVSGKKEANSRCSFVIFGTNHPEDSF